MGAYHVHTGAAQGELEEIEGVRIVFHDQNHPLIAKLLHGIQIQAGGLGYWI
jgi:hypothetical protein